MALPADSQVALSIIDDRTTLAQYKDGSGNSLTNAIRLVIVTDTNGVNATLYIVDLIAPGAQTSGSGTRYAAYAPGSTSIRTDTGVMQIKTSAVGATDVWVDVGAQT